MNAKDAAVKAAIEHLLATNDRAVCRALIAIYKRQTAAEQAAGTTIDHNGRGFTGVDGEFLSSFARSCLEYGSLTGPMMYHARRKLPKYWRQLAEIAQENGRPIQPVREEETV